jgi:predicted nuclease of predicted toxin-antitoxin system
LLTEAEAQDYIVFTEDKDFGELVYRDRRNSHGVILLRMEILPASQRPARLQVVWTVIESHLPGNFLVVTRNKVRVRPLTPP